MKLAIIISHPIQYLIPFFKKLAHEPSIDLTVYYTWDFGVQETYDPEFGEEVKWDIPLFEGYKHKFLKNYSPKPSSDFWGQINPGILSEMRKNKFDAVLIYGWNSFTNWLVIFYTLFSKTKIFLRGESPLNQEVIKPKWKVFFKKLILKPLFSKISAFLYIGEENRKFYKCYKIPDEKLFFVPYAVDNERFIAFSNELISRRKELRKKLGISENDFVIIFTGKFIPKKRPLDLLKGYELFARKIPNSRLIFVGDGPLRSELERYVREKNIPNVVFAGFKNQTELPEFYTVSDLFVLPSGFGETWGLVVNEAMCFRLPVIVSDAVGCSSDLIRDNGFIFPLGDVEKLSECINKVYLENKDNRLGKKSFEIIQGYSFSEGVQKIALLSKSSHF